MVKRNRLFSLIPLTILALALGLLVSGVYAQAEKAKEAFNKGVTADKAGKADEAIAAYKDAIAADASYFDAYMNLGKNYFEKAAYDDALKMFQTAAEKNSKSADAQANIVRVQFTKRNFVEAEAAYKRAIAIDDKNVELQKELGKLYFAKSALPELAQTCDKISQMNAADDQTYYWLGKANEKQDKTADAIAAY